MPLLQRKGNPNVVKAFSPEEAQGALASGEWEGRGGGPVAVPSRDTITGEERNLPLDVAARNPNEFSQVAAGESVRAAMAEAREQEFGSQGALAFAEGGASTLSFGTSDWLLKALGANTADRAEINPGWRATGEIGTAIAATALTGGGAIGGVGRALAKTPFGKLAFEAGKLGTRMGGVGGVMAAETIEGLAAAGGGVVSKLAIKDEEFTAKSALLDLGLGGLVGMVGGGVTGGLQKIYRGAKAAGAAKGMDLDSLEGKDFEAVAGKALSDLDRVDNEIIKNVAVRRGKDASGEAFVKNVKDDYIAQATRDLDTVGSTVESHAAKLVAEPPPVVPPTVSRIADIPDDLFAHKYNARNHLQLLDEANDDLKLLTGSDTPELARLRRRISREVDEFDKDIGTGGTKGRSKLYGPEPKQTVRTSPTVRALQDEYNQAKAAYTKATTSGVITDDVLAMEQKLPQLQKQIQAATKAAEAPTKYTTTADIPKVKQLFQDYSDAVIRRANATGNGRLADDLMGGMDRNGMRKPGLQDLLDEVNDELAPAVQAAQNKAAKHAAIQAAHTEASAMRKAFIDNGGFGDTVTLGANPGSAMLRGAAADDYLTSLTKLAQETGQEIPESFTKSFAKFREDLDKIAGQGATKGPLSGADLAELRAARVAFKQHRWSVPALLNKSQDAALAQLDALNTYTKHLENAGSKLAIPNALGALEENAAALTGRLESLTGLSAGDIDKAYKRIVDTIGGPAVDFKGPAADLHKLWVVNQALQKNGEFAKAFRSFANEADKARGIGAVARAGVRRAAGFMAFKAGTSVGGPIAGSALAGSVGRKVDQMMRGGGFLAEATGSLMSKIGMAANLSSKATRMIGVNMGTIVRNTSFGEKPAPKGETPRQSFERLSTEVTSAVNNPGFQTKLNDQLGEIRDLNWGVGDKMEIMVMDAMKYLADAIPKDPGVLQKWGLSTWKPTDAEVREFNNKVAAVVDPMNSLNRFMGGGGSPAEAEAIRKVHPEIFNEFQSAFMDNLVSMRDKVKGSTRVRLGILFDAPVDSRLRPEFRAFMKEHWIARAEEQKPLDVNAGMSPEQSTPAQKLLG